jgi:ATP-dependent helicase/nuclease subunit B
LRRELGLPDSQHAAAQLRGDLAGLICCSEEVVFSWQMQRNGEANLPGTDLQLLDLVLQRAGLPSAVTVAPDASQPAAPRSLPPSSSPVLDAARVPTRLTASGLSDLMACPYRYYARHVLGLGAGDEVEEAWARAASANWCIACCTISMSHTRVWPMTRRRCWPTTCAPLIAAAFGGAIARNFQEHAWADRLHDRADAYIAWAVQREAEGLAVRERRAETQVRTRAARWRVTVARRSHRPHRPQWSGRAGAARLQAAHCRSVKKTLKGGEDVQLAFYTLLEGDAVSEAAYLALDESAPVPSSAGRSAPAAQSLQALVSEAVSRVARRRRAACTRG